MKTDILCDVFFIRSGKDTTAPYIYNNSEDKPIQSINKI